MVPMADDAHVGVRFAVRVQAVLLWGNPWCPWQLAHRRVWCTPKSAVCDRQLRRAQACCLGACWKHSTQGSRGLGVPHARTCIMNAFGAGKVTPTRHTHCPMGCRYKTRALSHGVSVQNTCTYMVLGPSLRTVGQAALPYVRSQHAHMQILRQRLTQGDAGCGCEAPGTRAAGPAALQKCSRLPTGPQRACSAWRPAAAQGRGTCALGAGVCTFPGVGEGRITSEGARMHVHQHAHARPRVQANTCM